MRIFLLMGLIVFAQPAQACHRFSTWKYPFPQRCNVVTRVVAKPTPDRSWFVEIAPPVFDEEAARQRAVEQLKHALSAILVTRDPP